MAETKTTFAVFFLFVLMVGVVWAGLEDKGPDFPQRSVISPFSQGGDEYHGSPSQHESGQRNDDKHNGGDHEGGGHDDGGGGSGHNVNDHGNGGGSDNHESERPNETHGPGSGHHDVIHYDAEYSFYGIVRWSGGAVVAGSRKLVGDNPWLEILAPGMRLEVQGEVEGSAIRVSRVEVRYPHSWSFYQGPADLIGLSGGWVKVWFSENYGISVFKQVTINRNNDHLLLAACYNAGSWRSLPTNLKLPISPTSWGWWLLVGRETKNNISWELDKKLPGGNCY